MPSISQLYNDNNPLIIKTPKDADDDNPDDGGIDEEMHMDAPDILKLFFRNISTHPKR